MRFRILNGVLLISLFSAFHAWADGIVVTKVKEGTKAKVDVGDQRAVLYFNDEGMTLIIDPGFHWEKGGAAWVIPLPARPDEVYEAERDFLDDVEWITRPRFLEMEVQKPCGGGCMGSTKASGVEGGSLKEQAQGVLVWESDSLGNLDYVIISGKDGGDIKAWLKDNGFYITAKVEAALQRMNTEKTYFFAAKLTETPQKGKTMGAVGFRFEGYNTPFYPVALTAAGLSEGQHLDVLLWVISPWPEELFSTPVHAQRNGTEAFYGPDTPVIKGAVPIGWKLVEEEIPEEHWAEEFSKAYDKAVEEFLASGSDPIKALLEFSYPVDLPQYEGGTTLRKDQPLPFSLRFNDGWYFMFPWSFADIMEDAPKPSKTSLEVFSKPVFLQRYLIRVESTATEDIQWEITPRPYNQHTCFIKSNTIPCDSGGCETERSVVGLPYNFLILLMISLFILGLARRRAL